MNRRRVSREPKGDEEYEESSVLFVDLQQRGGKCAEGKNEKIVQKKSQDQKKGAPSALLLNTTFEHLFLAAFCRYMMVPLETTLHYLHKLLLNNYKRTNILLLLAHTNERTNARTTSSTCDIFFSSYPSMPVSSQNKQ
jgi:hypothetical protein